MEVDLTQPVLRTLADQMIHAATMDAIADSAITRGLATADEVDRLVRMLIDYARTRNGLGAPACRAGVRPPAGLAHPHTGSANPTAALPPSPLSGGQGRIDQDRVHTRLFGELEVIEAVDREADDFHVRSGGEALDGGGVP